MTIEVTGRFTGTPVPALGPVGLVLLAMLLSVAGMVGVGALRN